MTRRRATNRSIGEFPAAPYTSEHTFHEILVLYSHFAALTSTLPIHGRVVLPPHAVCVTGSGDVRRFL